MTAMLPQRWSWPEPHLASCSPANWSASRRCCLRTFVEAGRPLIGICNGFQVLTRTRLLPGALGHNAQGRFDCRWVVLDPVPKSVSIWTRGIEDPIHCPLAHGEGRYVHPDPDSLAAAGQGEAP